VLSELADPSLPPDRRSALEASLARTRRVVGDRLADRWPSCRSPRMERGSTDWPHL